MEFSWLHRWWSDPWLHPGSFNLRYHHGSSSWLCSRSSSGFLLQGSSLHYLCVAFPSASPSLVTSLSSSSNGTSSLLYWTIICGARTHLLGGGLISWFCSVLWTHILFLFLWFLFPWSVQFQFPWFMIVITWPVLKVLAGHVQGFMARMFILSDSSREETVAFN